jgi:hypothetical protein
LHDKSMNRRQTLQEVLEDLNVCIGG